MDVLMVFVGYLGDWAVIAALLVPLFAGVLWLIDNDLRPVLAAILRALADDIAVVAPRVALDLSRPEPELASGSSVASAGPGQPTDSLRVSPIAAMRSLPKRLFRLRLRIPPLLQPHPGTRTRSHRKVLRVA